MTTMTRVQRGAGAGSPRPVWALAALLAMAGCSTVPPAAKAPEPPLSPSVQWVVVPPRAPVVAAPVAPLPPAADLPRASDIESPGVAARFPDPTVDYRTPAFELGHAAYTTNTEVRDLLRALVREPEGVAGAPGIRLLQLGTSQARLPLEALLFTHDATTSEASARASRPTVLLVAQQHGDEPAGSEALLVIARQLASGSLRPLRERINVIVLPRANPDGAANDQRLSASGIDVNRDHLLLRTPEAQAQAQLVRTYEPIVVVDAHEYSAIGRNMVKFDAVERFDALLQYATVANLPDFITKAAEQWFRQPLLDSLREQGLSAEWYYTSSTDTSDRKVSMGGVQPDTARNVHGLRNAVSILVETRGVGLGRAHLKRRVHTHVVAITGILNSAATRAPDLAKLRRFVDGEVVAMACHGDVIIEAAATPSEYVLQMLDPITGADKPVTVAWNSALQLVPLRVRARPCGYWLGADQGEAVMRLRGLGVRVVRLAEGATLRAETYVETARETGARPDVRGTMSEGGSAVLIKVALQPLLIEVNAGSYYVPLDQPLAHLVVAALEPDTPNSYFANRLIGNINAQARVLSRPEARMTTLP